MIEIYDHIGNEEKKPLFNCYVISLWQDPASSAYKKDKEEELFTSRNISRLAEEFPKERMAKSKTAIGARWILASLQMGTLS